MVAIQQPLMDSPCKTISLENSEFGDLHLQVDFFKKLYSIEF